VEKLQQIASLLRGARFAVALTGAGVSTASGIPDYRTPGTGLWERYDPAVMANIQAFRDDPRRFWAFYTQRMGGLAQASPNPAHEALARLEALGYLRGLITQNIDRLHRRAGSERLVEVHGSIAHLDCLTCGARYPTERAAAYLADPEPLPLCDCGGPLKPGVVLFGEDLPVAALQTASRWAEEADVMLAVGSSLQVWPVAGLPELTLARGGSLVILTASSTPYDAEAAVVDRRPVEETLPRLVALLEAGPARG